MKIRAKVDSEVACESDVHPSGICLDGNSPLLERVPVEPGKHRIEVAVADRQDGPFDKTDIRELTFEEAHRQVVSFDSVEWFVWQ